MRAAACMMGIARPRPSAVRAPTAEQTDAGRVTSPSGLFLVEELCRLLCAAAGIIQRQAALLEMHGIRTADGALENEQQDALGAIREMAGEDAERCVCCGRIIPEGRMVCPLCEKGEKNNVDADNIPPFFHRIRLLQKRRKDHARRRASTQHGRQ